MRQILLLFSIVVIFATGCATPNEKSSSAYHSRLIQTAPTREAYLANLKSLTDYVHELQQRCNRIPELAMSSARLASTERRLHVHEVLETGLPSLRIDPEFWKDMSPSWAMNYGGECD